MRGSGLLLRKNCPMSLFRCWYFRVVIVQIQGPILARCWLGDSNETTRFRKRNCWFNGRVADSDARATTRAHAADRQPYEFCRGLSAGAGSQRRVRAGAGAIRLGRRTNVQIDLRWGEGDADRVRRYSAELAALAPDVILCTGGTTTGPLQKATLTVPIVFVNTTDPVGAGFVASLPRPGANITGFSGIEFGISGKWLELLKEIAPRVTRAAVFRDSAAAGQIAQFAAIQAVAPSLRVEFSLAGLGVSREMERAIKAFAGGSNGGMIVTASLVAAVNRDLIITLAARHSLPAVDRNVLS